jgi:hypothetical protein
VDGAHRLGGGRGTKSDARPDHSSVHGSKLMMIVARTPDPSWCAAMSVTAPWPPYEPMECVVLCVCQRSARPRLCVEHRPGPPSVVQTLKFRAKDEIAT